MSDPLNAYYYSFEPTGVPAVDQVLAAVASAGKAYHHTEDWMFEKDRNGKSEAEKIQEAANRAAEAFRSADKRESQP